MLDRFTQAAPVKAAADAPVHVEVLFATFGGQILDGVDRQNALGPQRARAVLRLVGALLGGQCG